MESSALMHVRPYVEALQAGVEPPAPYGNRLPVGSLEVQLEPYGHFLAACRVVGRTLAECGVAPDMRVDLPDGGPIVAWPVIDSSYSAASTSERPGMLTQLLLQPDGQTYFVNGRPIYYDWQGTQRRVHVGHIALTTPVKVISAARHVLKHRCLLPDRLFLQLAKCLVHTREA